jgi:hypothetical protein
VVYAKAPVAGPEVVLKYLARYVQGVALSNRRLEGLQQGVVTFQAKDYRDGGKPVLLRLPVEELLRRWVAHVLPRGFVKVRSYGLLHNRHRRRKVEFRVRRGAAASRERADREQELGEVVGAETATVQSGKRSREMVAERAEQG